MTNVQRIAIDIASLPRGEEPVVLAGYLVCRTTEGTEVRGINSRHLHGLFSTIDGATRWMDSHGGVYGAVKDAYLCPCGDPNCPSPGDCDAME